MMIWTTVTIYNYEVFATTIIIFRICNFKKIPGFPTLGGLLWICSTVPKSTSKLDGLASRGWCHRSFVCLGSCRFRPKGDGFIQQGRTWYTALGGSRIPGLGCNVVKWLVLYNSPFISDKYRPFGVRGRITTRSLRGFTKPILSG